MAASGRTGVTRRWQQAGGRLARLALGLLVVMLLLLGLPTGQGTDVAALSLPGWGKPGRRPAPIGAGAAVGLQEVAPPPATQQLRQALADRQPRLAIEAPAAESLLPDGPWTLRLRVDDWPLVDAGPLGLGPHLVVRLDDAAPRRLTSMEATMAPLAPGSHRLTVYAAWPWGEAVKNPGAWRQIRIHRVAVNPLSLPAPGSPKLLATSPAEPVTAEPVLVDWLLIDAPLQNLRADDASWRLRITVNGDSFLVDRQTPLWLRGWRPGSNALQLELVDPRGEPLNPPFNSLVREVRLASDALGSPWLGGRLTDGELARLLGEAPPMPATEPGPTATSGAEDAHPAELPPTAGSGSEPTLAPPPQDLPVSGEPQGSQQEREIPPLQEALPAPAELELTSEPRLEEGEAVATPAAPAPAPASQPDSLSLPAREELNPDGTVIRDEPAGPLARLRRRLGR
jgi:hypothetical protein